MTTYKCHCCNKPVKNAYQYEGKVYGLACLADILGCTQATTKKVAKKVE